MADEDIVKETGEIKGCDTCSHFCWTAISCLRGRCVPTRNKTCKFNTWRKRVKDE